MRMLYVIGIGAGDPRQVTVQAVEAIRQVDTFFVIGKGETKRELTEVRSAILAGHAAPEHRVVSIADPPRERTVEGAADYREVVEDWHRRRAELLAEAFDATEGVGGILVWGDPSLYDSTLRMVQRVLDAGTRFEYTVIPGVTSAQALAAAHRIVLHEIGEPVHITTGRRLRTEGVAADGSTLVMLDGECSFTQVPGDDLHIWWGAYLGMPDETLIEGPLRAVEDRIVRRRNELREAKGWVMDIYLLRRAD
ncbi:precorrin-6A synthase (deacetylating) [Nocardia sp. MDA0666]|uniref:precorrin-6A synthase (deacetylating) n=1 Tax=Nocardia sp. MDA0666 TaxID=2135448 RepID=UPI000D12E8B0|nr:precorrin-6A synthase (deacetylating) [Nocardia sp. MDA0666]PSR67912.1 precorrin-6A synthase (deacetylating) [Nocardia sp. MDA0666]